MRIGRRALNQKTRAVQVGFCDQVASPPFWKTQSGRLGTRPTCTENFTFRSHKSLSKGALVKNSDLELAFERLMALVAEIQWM